MKLPIDADGEVVLFGTWLRAARLCYHWSQRIKCFIRMTNQGDQFLVELRPNDVSALDTGRGKLHVMVDSDEELEEMIQLSPVLRNIKRVHRAINLMLNEQGEFL